MAVVNKGNITTQTSTNSYAVLLIAHVGDVKDVLAKIVNNHAGNDIHWRVHGWRVPAVSSIDAGRARHPTTIPSDAVIIQAEEAVGTSGASKEKQIDNLDTYTHIGIDIKSVVGGNQSNDVDANIWGREEHV